MAQMSCWSFGAPKPEAAIAEPPAAAKETPTAAPSLSRRTLSFGRWFGGNGGAPGDEAADSKPSPFDQPSAEPPSHASPDLDSALGGLAIGCDVQQGGRKQQQQQQAASRKEAAPAGHRR